MKEEKMSFYITFLLNGKIMHCQVDGKDEEEALSHLRVTYKKAFVVKVKDITQIVINKATYGF